MFPILYKLRSRRVLPILMLLRRSFFDIHFTVAFFLLFFLSFTSLHLALLDQEMAEQAYSSLLFIGLHHPERNYVTENWNPHTHFEICEPRARWCTTQPSSFLLASALSVAFSHSGRSCARNCSPRKESIKLLHIAEMKMYYPFNVLGLAVQLVFLVFRSRYSQFE